MQWRLYLGLCFVQMCRDNWYFILLNFICFNITVTVSCGGHSADTCENCVFDASCVFQGSSWCNGDCIWDSDFSKCIKTSK